MNSFIEIYARYFLIAGLSLGLATLMIVLITDISITYYKKRKADRELGDAFERWKNE